MMLAEDDKHEDFLQEYKKFQKQFDKLYWRKHPDWFLQFKEFKDEKFKPIAEYQGFYFISNYGKIVSFKRKVPGLRRAKMINNFLAISLNHFGSIRLNYIHELVYTHFVGPKKAYHRVVHKDNDVTNNYYKNLEEVKIVQLLESKSGNKLAGASSLHNNQPVKVEKPANLAKTTKPLKVKKQRKSRKLRDELDAGVLQFNREGKFVREFFSIREAARDLKRSPGLILACLEGKRKMAGGFQWRYSVDPNFDDGIFDIKPVLPSSPSGPSRKQSVKSICQYDRDGNFIREFPSVKDAAQAMGVTRAAISFSMQKPNRTAGGYKWKYKEK